MNVRRILACIAIGAAGSFALTACGPDEEERTPEETGFVEILEEVYPSALGTTQESEDKAIAAGQSTCILLEDGVTGVVVAAQIMRSGYGPEEAGAILAAGAVSFCPDEYPRIDEEFSEF